MPAQPTARRRVSAPSVVGRSGELDALADALAGAPAVAVVAGEAGIGKTRLVTELRERDELADRRFITGACRRIREPFPLGPLVEAVGQLRPALAAVPLSPVAGALRPLLPELSGVLPERPDELPERAAERHRVFRAMAEVLGAVGPAVLAIEDAHWADEHSVEFLGYLLADLPPTLSVLITFRHEEADPAVRALTATLPPEVGHLQVALAPLEPAQTGELAAAILGVDRVSTEFATYLRDRASGLPFVIEELLALMQARGVLTRRDDGWVRRDIGELDVPAGVRDPVLERFSRIGADARAVTEAAAVLQVPIPEQVLVATSRLPAPRARPAVAEALQSGLLVELAGGEDTVGFRHVLAAQAIYESLPGPRRRELHTRAASALAAQDPVPLGQRAYHLRHAGQDGAWVQAAEQAADRALSLGHDDEAVRLLEEVLRDAALTAPQRGRLAVKLARGAHQALHFGPAVGELLAGVLGQRLPRAQRGELRLRLALLLERTGADVHRHRQLLAEAVEDLTEQPDLQAHAMAGLGIPRVPGVPLAEYRRWLQRALEVLPSVDDPALQVSLLGKVAMVQVAVGDPQWLELSDRILTRTGGEPRQPAELSAFHSVGANACYAGHLVTGDRLLAAVQAGATGADSSWRELAAGATRVLLDYCRGSWDGLAQRADNLRDQLVDHAPGRADVEVVAGCLALAWGETDRAAHRLEALARDLSDRGAYDILPFAVAATIRLALGTGDTVAAAGQADRFVTTVESVPLLASAAWALPAVTEALASAGQQADAQELVARWERHLGDLDAPLAPVALAAARGILAAASGGWSPAGARHRAAAAGYERLTCWYEAAQAHERAGEALLHAGDLPSGAAEVQAALSTYQRLGAWWDLDRASGTARQYAVPVPTRHRRGRRGYGVQLSPRERKVAELAADGQRDREIAQALFVSTSTVRKHLTAAMRKLGANSRVGLAHQLSSGEPSGK